jgi:hypothetical protein
MMEEIFRKHSELLLQGDQIKCTRCDVYIICKTFNINKHLKTKKHKESFAISALENLVLIVLNKCFCTKCLCLTPKKYNVNITSLLETVKCYLNATSYRCVIMTMTVLLHSTYHFSKVYIIIEIFFQC